MVFFLFLTIIENSSFQCNFLLFISPKDFCHHPGTYRCSIILVLFLYVVFSFNDFRPQVIMLFHEVSVLQLHCIIYFFFFIIEFFCKQTKLGICGGWWGKLGLGFELFLHAWLNGLREAMQEFLGAYFLFSI